MMIVSESVMKSRSAPLPDRVKYTLLPLPIVTEEAEGLLTATKRLWKER